MNTSVNSVNREWTPTTEELISDLKKTVENTQMLLAEVGTYTADKLTSTHPSIAARLTFAREKLEEARDEVTERTKEMADATNRYVIGHPWKSLGIALVGAAFIGFLIARHDE